MKHMDRLAFESWIEDGNAMVMDGAWTTQDAQYTNRIETKAELWGYFLKEYFGMKPEMYLFNELRPYMERTSAHTWELKYSYASDWVVDLFTITRNAIHGRLGDWKGTSYEGGELNFRIEKATGRFGRYGKVFITLNADADPEELN